MSMRVILANSEEKRRIRSIELPYLRSSKKQSYLRNVPVNSKKSKLARRSLYADDNIKKSLSFRPKKINHSIKTEHQCSESNKKVLSAITQRSSKPSLTERKLFD